MLVLSPWLRALRTNLRSRPLNARRARLRLDTLENRTVPAILVGDDAAIEGDSAAFTVSLDSSSASTVSVVYSTADGTAVAGDDYTAASGTLSFAPGETSKTVLVAMINDDLVEPAETFTLNLSDPDGDTILNGQGVGTIFDNDGPVAPPSDLVSWWTGDEDGTDHTGPNDGTLNNGVAILPGKVDNGFSFDETNYVSADTTGLPTGNADRTMEMWVQINAFGSGESFFAGYGSFGSSAKSYGIGALGDQRLFFSQWGEAIVGPALQAGQWYHVAVTNVGNSGTLYLDGQGVANALLTINTSIDSQFNIGRIPGSLGDTRQLNGMVDEVSVYSRALNAGEIQAIFAAGSHGKAKDMSVTINQLATQPDPTNVPSIAFEVHFSEPVTGFDPADVSFDGSTVGGTLVASVSGTGAVYVVTVTGMTGSGTVVASIPAGAAMSAAGNSNGVSTSSDNSVTFDSLGPTVTIDQAASQADPTAASPIAFAVHFSEPVIGFDGSVISLDGSTVGGTLSATVIGSGTDYTVEVSGMTGAGTVVASIPAGKVSDEVGNLNAASTSTDNVVTYDSVAPSVTINQAVGQADPTSASAITFDVKFNEPVTAFTVADVNLSASTTGGNLVATVTGNLDTYTVTVTGMTTRGSVVASIPAGAAIDASGNASLASTSTDNSIDFLNTGTIGFTQAVINTTEDNAVHSVTITVTRAGATEGPVSIQYGTSDGSAHASDYTTTTGTLSWADGEGGDKTFAIDIQPDAINEGKELINLTLSNPVGGPGLALTTAAIAIAPSDGQGPGTYFDSDGDKYTIKLNGKTGSLLYYRSDPDGDGRGPIDWIQLIDTLPDPLAPMASLVINVSKLPSSTDNGTVRMGAISGTGLKAINARKANLDGDGINLSGYLGALTIGNITNGADVTTLASANPKQSTRIRALAIGADTAISVGAHVANFTATAFGAGSFQAPSVGTMIVKGEMAADIDISGVGVDPTKKALTMLRVGGAVTDSDIFVHGNVGAVVVGAFRHSRLFAGYVGPDVPDVSGFNFLATINSFRSIGKVDGFQDSRVIASEFKSVSINNLHSTNAGEKFGFYAKSSMGAISVVGPTKFNYNPALPNTQGVGDFEVKLVT